MTAPRTGPGPDAPLRVVIAGAGVAGLEALIALRSITGDRTRVTLVSPDDDFVYSPLSVGEPFALGPARRIPVAQMAHNFQAELRSQTLASVDPGGHTVTLGDGSTVAYDKLLVAVGARREPVYGHSVTFRGPEDSDALHGLVQDVEGGYSRKIVFIVPAGLGWSLPLYELALMTAERAFSMSTVVDISFVTPEERPLAVFGRQASEDVAALLEQAGIRVYCSTTAEVPHQGTVVLRPGEETLTCDRVVALPVIKGAHIAGLPEDRNGFLPIDAHVRVTGVEDVYAAGDGTNFPIKQGGVACQEADVAAEDIARAAGIPVETRLFRPVLRGQLMTGGRPQFMRRDMSDPTGAGESTQHMLWWPPSKVAGKYLAPYVALQEVHEREDDSKDVKLHGYEFAAR